MEAIFLCEINFMGILGNISCAFGFYRIQKTKI